MVTPELIEYIKKCREQNIPDEQIKTALKEQGWVDEDINAGISQAPILEQPVLEQLVPPIIDTVSEQKSKKKILVPVIIIIGILLIGGGVFGYFQFFAKESVVPGLTNAPAGTEENTKTETGNLSAEDICNKIEEESNKYSCLARIKGDVSICEKADRVKNLCISDVIRDKGIKSLNINDCGEESSCFSGVAIISQNSDLCKNIDSEYIRNRCLIGVAVFSENISFCEKIEDDYYKGQCKTILSGDINTCSDFTSRSSDAPSCKNTIAVLKNDISLCSEPRDMFGWLCYESIALRTSDSSVCKNLDIAGKEDMFSSAHEECVVKINKDISVCNSLKNTDDTFYKDSCLIDLAESLSGLNIYNVTLNHVSIMPQQQ